MPQDDVQPCPHCGGTGEVRGETLAATVATGPQSPFRVTMRHHSGIGAPGEIAAFDELREARRSVQQWRIETQGAWQYTITDANGNTIPNDTGCSICTDPNCSDPCGKH